MATAKLVIGNWKMELSHKAAYETASALKSKVGKKQRHTTVVVAPSFPSLPAVAELLHGTALEVAAQNVHWEERGAWTGEVSVTQIKPYVKWCIIGHSERRALTGETDEVVAQKMNLLLRHGITPVVCLGETADERAAGASMERVTAQMQQLVRESERVAVAKVVIVYEPVWAISANGPGELPDPDDISGTVLLIRKVVTERFGREVAERLRVLYGGSVNARTAASFLAAPGVDGVLVGSASVHPLELASIVAEAEKA